MGIIMLVTLYTSRVVLAQLGIDNYGIYVVVGGVVTMFSFLNGSMSTSTQRYLNFELGNPQSTVDSLKNVFSTALSIHLAIATIIVGVAETIGLWFVNHKLIIPPESMYAANIVYQSAILSFCVSIMQTPFNAAIIAHEKMHLYAVVSILEAALKLGIAYALIIVPADKLAFYGCFVFGVHFIIAAIYISICLGKFEECSLRFRFITGLFKEMSKFAGWNMFGSIAWLVRGQGMGIILNLFFGPALNAAKGVSDQVSNAVTTLNSNFQVALNPQITKNYASQNLSEMELLTYRGIKFSSILLWVMALPIMMNSSMILSLWLEEVPQYASLFVILILMDCVSGNLFGTPLMTSLAATGNIRTYQITVSCILLLILPAAYISLRLGFPPESIFYLNILFNVISGIARFWFCKRQLNYSVRFYFKYVIVPIFTVLASSTFLSYAIKMLLEASSISPLLSMIILIALSITTVIISGWYLGFNKQERHSLIALILQKITKNG